jgi:hypothetical protein
VKILSLQRKIVKAVRECQVFKGKPIKITAKTLKARRTWTDVFQALKKITAN